jgi:sugar O-acyltransferase (sialic acid O-acetyltransferase NeuD family)
MKNDIILIGGGGHCKSVIDVIEQEGKYQIKGIIDSDPTLKKVLGYPVVGGDEMLASLIDENTHFLITVGQIKSYEVRLKIANLLHENSAKLATVISPLAYVSKHAKINKGTVVMHKSIVNADAEVGKHCIINTLANVEHDVKVEDFCHLSTAAIVNGGAYVKRGSFIGSNATISNYIVIDENSIVSAGKFIKR